LIPIPVPPYMFALRFGPRGRRAYPTLPAIFEDSMPAANSCHSAHIATWPAMNASARPVQSQPLLAGCAIETSLLYISAPSIDRGVSSSGSPGSSEPYRPTSSPLAK
jgi:hypothetical protein